jgi:starch synthase
VDILLIAPEIAPYSRSGELGDVCAALPKGLRSVGHKVTVISPLWSSVDPGARALARRLSGVEVALGAERFTCTVHDGRTTGGVELAFIGQPELIGSSPDSASADLRAALTFCQAAAQIAALRTPTPEIIHAHGYFAAASLPLLAASLPGPARVLSLHDASRRGALTDIDSRTAPALHGGASFRSLSLPDALREVMGGAHPSLLAAGIAGAQRVIARSQTEAVELLESSDAGMRSALEGKLTGIANGLDAARWNPLTDPLLPARYDAVSTEGKARCKAMLQLEVGVPVRPEVTVIACAPSGPAACELFAQALPGLLRNDLQLIVTGVPAAELPGAQEAQDRYGERIAFTASHDERSLHRVVAAADLMLVLTADGELHLAGQRYGAPPIAPDAAPICDAVVDCDASLTTGTGFLFTPGNRDEVVAATQRACAAHTKQEAFAALQRRTMRLDLSWERVARSYEHVYKTLVAAR